MTEDWRTAVMMKLAEEAKEKRSKKYFFQGLDHLLFQDPTIIDR